MSCSLLVALSLLAAACGPDLFADKVQTLEYPNRIVHGISVSPTGKYLAITGEKNLAVYQWMGERYVLQQTMPCRSYFGYNRYDGHASFSDDDRLLACLDTASHIQVLERTGDSWRLRHRFSDAELVPMDHICYLRFLPGNAARLFMGVDFQLKTAPLPGYEHLWEPPGDALIVWEPSGTKYRKYMTVSNSFAADLLPLQGTDILVRSSGDRTNVVLTRYQLRGEGFSAISMHTFSVTGARRFATVTDHYFAMKQENDDCVIWYWPLRGNEAPEKVMRIDNLGRDQWMSHFALSESFVVLPGSNGKYQINKLDGTNARFVMRGSWGDDRKRMHCIEKLGIMLVVRGTVGYYDIYDLGTPDKTRKPVDDTIDVYRLPSALRQH